jgi:hypothetical protein
MWIINIVLNICQTQIWTFCVGVEHYIIFLDQKFVSLCKYCSFRHEHANYVMNMLIT